MLGRGSENSFPEFKQPTMTSMKTMTTMAAAVMILAGGAMAQVAESKAVPPLTTSEQKMRNTWSKSKEYMSDDEAVFRQSAQSLLTSLGKEIDAVEAKAGSTPPVYFQTRLQSLKQQQLYLAAKLGELNREVIKD